MFSTEKNALKLNIIRKLVKIPFQRKRPHFIGGFEDKF